MGFNSVQVSCFFASLLLASSFGVINAEVQEGSVRLMNEYNSDPSEGRLEIYHAGEWGTVCDDAFDTDVNGPMVACRMLGYTSGGHVTPNLPYGRSSGRIWLDNVVCIGTESSIVDCSHNYWGSNDCSHSEDVAVKCVDTITTTSTPRTTPGTTTPRTTTVAVDGSVRLVNTYDPSDDSSGRLEVYHSGAWGTICHDSSTFETQTATVACRMLGFTSGEKITTSMVGSGNIWLHAPSCLGNEANLVACSNDGWGEEPYQTRNHDCNHYQDMSVKCYNKQTSTGTSTTVIVTTESLTTTSFAPKSVAVEGSVRLVNTNDPSDDSSGRLEVYHSGTWGTVCDDASTFGTKSATVVCRTLGFSSGGKTTTSAAGSGDIWLHTLSCFGNEANLLACSNDGWGDQSYQTRNHGCSHYQDVSVKCYNKQRCIPNLGCAFCTVSTKCDVCNSPTLGPDNNGQGTCSPCRVSNCSYCGVNGADLCDRCNSGFILSNDNSTCLACNASSCATCSSSSSCTSCNPGFYLSLNSDNNGRQYNTCLPCAANCKTCSQSGSDQCDTCIDGYGFYPSSRFCAPCSASNCAACYMSTSTSCDRCVNGFYWDDRYDYSSNMYRRSCERCTSALANCASCDSVHSCSQCLPGYVLTYYKNCITQYEYDSNSWRYSGPTTSRPYYYQNYIYYTDGTMRTLAIVFGCLFGVSALIIVLFTICKIKHVIGAKCLNRGRTVNRDSITYLTPPAYCSETAAGVYNEGPALDGLPAYDDVSSSVASGLQLRVQADNAPLLARDEQQERRAAAYADV